MCKYCGCEIEENKEIEITEENTEETYDPYKPSKKGEPSDFDVAFNILGLF